MNIALFIKDFAAGDKFSKNGLPTKSGAEFHGENHALQLIKRGNNVTIMAKKRKFTAKAREYINGIDLVRLHEPARWLEILMRLFTTHRHIDAFYIIGTPKFAVWAILYANLMGKPVTLALTGKAEIFDATEGWRNKIFAKCTNYIATTHEIKKGFIEKGHIEAHKITVLAHGIDTNKYTKVDEISKIALREKNGICDRNTPICLFCARIVLNKGIDTLLKVWPIVHEKHPKAKLFVVGGGLHKLMKALRKLSQDTDGSVVVTGEVERPQEYYQMSDVYIFPSRHEGLPTSLIEAMSSGLTPVTSNIGGCDDLVFNGETGYRVETESSEDFAKMVDYLFEHVDERKKMGENASKLTQRICDYSVVIDKLESIIGSKEAKCEDYLQDRG